VELICSCSFNHGQACIAGTRIFVQSGIYDKFLAKLTESAKAIKMGDPFAPDTAQGPLVSKLQFDVCCLSEYYVEFHLMGL
jgi:aldehyde dehydrogenase (NAD+)